MIIYLTKGRLLIYMTEITRQKILKSARKLMYLDKCDHVSLAMIASEVGIKKPSLYYYFESKEDIYKELFLQSLKDLSENFDNLEKEKNNEEKIRKLLILIIRHVHFIEFLAERIDRKFLQRRAFLQKREKFIKRTEKIISDYLGRDLKYPRESALALMGAVGNISLDEIFFKRNKIKDEEIADKILKVIKNL